MRWVFDSSERKRCFAEMKVQQEQGLISPNDKKAMETYLMNIRSNDATKISWSRGLFTLFCKDEKIN